MYDIQWTVPAVNRFFCLFVFLLVNSNNSFAAEEYVWYAASATSNLYLTADDACANYNMAQAGYPSCIYQSSELWSAGSPASGAKCLHKCGTNVLNIINAGVKPMEYVALVTEETPIPKQCSGNPIDTDKGSKIQIETDINKNGIGQLFFARTYNNFINSNNEFWFNSYMRSIRVIDPITSPIIKFKSLPYTSKSATCLTGWNELKTKISNSWAAGVTAQYVNEKCLLIRNNTVVKILPIVRNISSNQHYAPDLIQLIRENGTTYQYHSKDNNSFFEMNGEPGRLEYLNTSTVAWRFKSNNGDIEDYNAGGKLLSITASNGMKQELFYDATSGLLSRVKDSTGRELLFAYAGNQISSVTVDGNKTTSYSYNALGLITLVTRPDNTTRIYHYEDSRFPTALTGITDERGTRYATWAYDAQGRAISSEHAGGAEKTLLAFNADGSTTVTNALNKQTIYRFDDIAGARRVTKVEGQPTTNCVGANQDYTYTAEGWIASKTDWKGIKTTFTYNSVGQEISRTEAFGTPEARTVTTEWHSTLYVKTKVTEPEKEIIYSYDANGRLLNQSIYNIDE